MEARQKKLQYNRNYYQKNKAKLLEDARRKIHCESCDKYVRKDQYNRHLKSYQHFKKSQ